MIFTLVALVVVLFGSIVVYTIATLPDPRCQCGHLESQHSVTLDECAGSVTRYRRMPAELHGQFFYEERPFEDDCLCVEFVEAVPS